MAREVEGTALEMRHGVKPIVSSNLTPSAVLGNICATIFVYMARSKFRLEWDAHEYEHKERGSDWFWSVGILSVALAIVCIIFGNIILALLILVAAFALTLFINRPPEHTHVVIDERGITRGKIQYPFETLKSFYIDDEHSHPKILLRSRKVFMPIIIVHMSKDTDVDDLHNALSEFLEEDFHSLPFVERILEYLGF